MMTKTSLACGSALGALMALALVSGASAQETTTAWKGAPQFSNDTLTFKVRGRVYMDVVSQEVDRETGADFSSQVSRVRTARLGVEGTWNQNWAYKAEAAISSGGGTTQWEDVVLEYKPNDFSSIMVGNFKTVSLENISSSRYITFMERGPFNDIIDAGRVMNISGKMNGENWTVQAAISGDSINAADPTVTGTAGGSDQVSINARATWAPIVTDTQTLHLGIWGRQRDRSDQAGFNYQVRNNTNYGARYTSSGAIGDNDTMIGLEGLFIQGPFSVQAEWANIDIDRTNGLTETAQAYYVAASWFVTGEKRNMDVKKGELGRTKILAPMTAGGFGAFELAARYDSADLTDITGAPTTAGEYTAWTLGANWYPFPYVRFMANYTRSTNDNFTVGSDVDVDTLQFRAQFDF
jgi:phosphate-selective porin OprO/OprP